MSYATIMVHVEIDGAFDARARLAAALAERFGANLIGMSAWMPRPRPLIDPDLAASEFKYLTSEIRRQGEKFKFKIHIDQEKVELRTRLEFPTECITHEMRGADLLVIGRNFRLDDPYLYPDVRAIVLNAGRPILTVPSGVDNLPGRCALIAWKNTREARRAVRDALPLLQKADHVFVVELISSGMNVADSQRGLNDVAAYLACHQVTNVATRVRPIETTTFEALSRMLKEEAVDLVVAGAYGHSRLGEWFLGGMTEDLLAHSPVCCLLSH